MVVMRNGWSSRATDGAILSAARAIELDPHDTIVLKGLAISAIVLHNFFHAVSPARENEFAFHPGGWAIFLHTVRQPELAIQALLSFFGYLGVSIFIFLSAYGLAKSHWDDEASWTQFMAGRIRKLFPIFAVVILPWTLIFALHTGLHQFLRSSLPQILFMLTGLAPLVPGMGLPPVGPWWFIPFILEFYAAFFLLRRLTKDFGWPGLVVLALLGIAVSSVAAPGLAHWHINLYETPLGRLPTLCLGIAAARFPFRVPASIAVAAGTVLVLGNEFRSFWPFTFTAAAVLSLWAYAEIGGSLRSSRVVACIGRYSILIFLLNGIVRDDFLSFATTPLLQLLFGAISAGASFTIAAIIHELVISPAPATTGTAKQVALLGSPEQVGLGEVDDLVDAPVHYGFGDVEPEASHLA